MSRESFDKPIFVISLDLEALWGVIRYRNHMGIDLLERNAEKYRERINYLLMLFDKYNIPATWAVVGHLFLDSCKKTDGIPHKNILKPTDDWYDFDPCGNLSKDPLFYGKDIVEKIMDSGVNHEIGYHSFSHVIFSECSKEVAEAEIKEGVRLAKEFGIELKSFVFPKNEIGHRDILKKYGFKIYRGETPIFWNSHQQFVKQKICGVLDKMIAQPVMPIYKDGIWEIPGSMIFCDPQTPRLLLLRAKLGLKRTIETNKIFHIWFHPWNLLLYDKISKDLDEFLSFVSDKVNADKIVVFTMGGLASRLEEKRR